MQDPLASKKKSEVGSEPADASCDELDFEQGLEQLERFVRQLEQGQLGLSDSLEAYQQGVARLRRCYALLEQAERKIELLSGVDAEGNPITAPYDDADESLEDKMQSRGRRRSGVGGGTRTRKSGGGSGEEDVDDGSKLF